MGLGQKLRDKLRAEVLSRRRRIIIIIISMQENNNDALPLASTINNKYAGEQ